jgi:hypothetical protein
MVSFDNLQGEAKKSAKVTYMKLKDGENRFRIVGNILPGYFYWVKGANGKDQSFECLQFDRDNEKFNQSLPDPVKELELEDGKGNPLRCGWGYRCQVINAATNNVEVLTLKKGMLQDIIKYAKKKKINPTDFTNGTWIKVERIKDGPQVFNVKYTVDPFEFEPTPLTEDELELVKELKPIDEIFVRETAEEQRQRLQTHINGAEDAADSDAEREAANEAANELDD